MVSCLEGGYRIQGGVVSAFARSVAAHVHALCDTHAAKWDPAEARWEHDRERAKLPVSRQGLELAGTAAQRFCGCVR